MSDDLRRRATAFLAVTYPVDDPGRRGNAADCAAFAASELARVEHRAGAAAERDRALASAAVLLRGAREALRLARHPARCAAAGERAETGALGPCDCGLDAALKALDGWGDVREWLDKAAHRAWLMGRACALNNAAGQPGGTWSLAVVEALSSPPALPDASAALTEFAASVMDWTLSNTTCSDDVIRSGQVADFTRRWLAGGER